MAQDLRDLFKKEQLGQSKLKAGHEARFLAKLDQELPVTKTHQSYYFLKVAASVALLLSVGFTAYNYFKANNPSVNTIVTTENPEEEKPQQITLGDLSPDLKKVEDYYVANINYEMSELEITEENQQILDDFLAQLATLNEEYNTLNEELNTIGPNDKTVTALIQNLQLRLQLLYKLKEKLNELKTPKNEFTDQQI